MHEEFTRLMSLALDQEADAGQLASLQSHLAECPACAATWTRWQAADVHLRADATLLAPAPGLADRVMIRLAAQRQRQQRRRWLGIGILLAGLGFMAVLVLALAALAWWSLSHPLQAGILASACTRFLSSALWPVRGVQTLLLGIGVSLPWLATSYLGCTIGLVAVWAWLLARAGRWRGNGWKRINGS
ncbi:MAG: anti-sigma factor family protein [Anaerolineae bacterium]